MFKYKTSIIGKTSPANQEDGGNTGQEITKTKKNYCCSIKTFRQFLEKFRYEVFLTLTWSENYVLTDITTQATRAAQEDIQQHQQ